MWIHLTTLSGVKLVNLDNDRSTVSTQRKFISIFGAEVLFGNRQGE
jgi:hypothetical protein